MGGLCTLSCSMLVAPMMVDVTCHLPCNHPPHQSGIVLKRAALKLSLCNMQSLAEAGWHWQEARQESSHDRETHLDVSPLGWGRLHGMPSPCTRPARAA